MTLRSQQESTISTLSGDDTIDFDEEEGEEEEEAEEAEEEPHEVGSGDTLSQTRKKEHIDSPNGKTIKKSQHFSFDR